MKSAMPDQEQPPWPKRSPSRPPSSRKPPNVSRYALTTHASEVSENPRSVTDRRQRHVHDRRVEHDHEAAQAEHVEREPASAAVNGHGHRRPFGRCRRLGPALRPELIAPGNDEFARWIPSDLTDEPGARPEDDRLRPAPGRSRTPRHVDALARLQLTAQRLGPSSGSATRRCELQELVAFAGLEDVLLARAGPGRPNSGNSVSVSRKNVSSAICRPRSRPPGAPTARSRRPARWLVLAEGGRAVGRGAGGITREPLQPIPGPNHHVKMSSRPREPQVVRRHRLGRVLVDQRT